MLLHILGLNLIFWNKIEINDGIFTKKKKQTLVIMVDVMKNLQCMALVLECCWVLGCYNKKLFVVMVTMKRRNM